MPQLLMAMVHHRHGKAADAIQYLTAGESIYDWNPGNAKDENAWMMPLIRREAEALIKPSTPPAAGAH